MSTTRAAAILASGLVWAAVSTMQASESALPPEQLASNASAALARGELTNAIALASQAIAGDAKNLRAWSVRGRAYSLLKRPAQAIPDFTAALALNPSPSPLELYHLHQARGEDHFRLGHFRESVADFDRCLELRPDKKPYHWQRGISCYYAGEFEKGRKQFELHQTVNAQDVENAVWHFLCVARLEGVEKARASLIPIANDQRVPMSQVHQLFAGKAKPHDVLDAANANNPSAAEKANRLFYAHLYLGLYYEALGDATLTRQYLFKAAADLDANHYMGDVARAHANVLRAKSPN